VADLARIAVIGTSGAGKTRLAGELSRRLGVPHLELDAVFHGPGWTSTPDEVALPRVAAAVAEDRWVIEGNWFGRLDSTVLDRATTIVWLDLERPVVMFRVIRRSLWRSISRRPMFNGNRESWRSWVRPSHPIRWSWGTMHERRVLAGERIAALSSAPEVVRLRTPADARRWLRSVPQASGMRTR
jgi:adenylate kinase family enzyme